MTISMIDVLQRPAEPLAFALTLSIEPGSPAASEPCSDKQPSGLVKIYESFVRKVCMGLDSTEYGQLKLRRRYRRKNQN